MYALIDIFNIYLLEFFIIMEKLQDILKEKFDICYVLNLSDRKDRRNNMETQFKEMNFDNINESTWLRYHYTTKFPYNGLIASAFNESGKGRFTKANEYDCARNHYAIVKECYDRGFSNILVMEDDIKFLKDNQTFCNYLNNTFLTFIHNIPVDYDILQFGGFTTDPRAKNILEKYDDNIYWTTHKDVALWNASMYALSRKGMQYYIAFMDKFFWVADGPLYKAPINDKIINSYISTIPLVIQADKKEILSDIRNDKNDRIDYKNDNVYESQIKLSDYY